MATRNATFPCVGYIAVNERGVPVPYVGWSYRPGLLRATYRDRFHCEMKESGYRVVKVEMREVLKGAK